MTTRSLCGFIGLICVVLTCAGYNANPAISITVTPLADRTISPTRDPNANLVNVEVVVYQSIGDTIVSPVVLRVSRVNGEGSTQTQNMTLVNAGFNPRYRVENLAVPQGKLRYEVEVPYTIALRSGTSGTRTARKVIEKQSPVPESCFFFDSPTPGWTSSRHRHWYEDASQPACRALRPQVLQNAPNAGSGVFSSGLRMSLIRALNAQGESVAGCFTLPGTWDYTSADFVSPDLSTTPGWKNATGFDLLAATDSILPDPIKILLMVELQDGRFFAETVNEALIYHDLGAYGPFGMSKSDTADAAIRRIHIRIFVKPFQNPVGNPPEASAVYVDRICPRN